MYRIMIFYGKHVTAHSFVDISESERFNIVCNILFTVSEPPGKTYALIMSSSGSHKQADSDITGYVIDETDEEYSMRVCCSFTGIQCVFMDLWLWLKLRAALFNANIFLWRKWFFLYVKPEKKHEREIKPAAQAIIIPAYS